MDHHIRVEDWGSRGWKVVRNLDSQFPARSAIYHSGTLSPYFPDEG